MLIAHEFSLPKLLEYKMHNMHVGHYQLSQQSTPLGLFYAAASVATLISFLTWLCDCCATPSAFPHAPTAGRP